jgi:hypothetical protein
MVFPVVVLVFVALILINFQKGCYKAIGREGAKYLKKQLNKFEKGLKQNNLLPQKRPYM